MFCLPPSLTLSICPIACTHTALVCAHLSPSAAALIQGEHIVFNMGRGSAIMQMPDRGSAQQLIDAGKAGCLVLGDRRLRVEWVGFGVLAGLALLTGRQGGLDGWMALVI